MESIIGKDDYHNIIREMIKHENEVRNSRNNWFMAVQGLLITSFINVLIHQEKLIVVTNTIYPVVIIIAFIGLVTSMSFLYAAWRSEKSVAMALACWDLSLLSRKYKIQNYPPVALITNGIIAKKSTANDIGSADWEKVVNDKMYGDNDCLKCMDKKLNQIDWVMPFKLIPKVFTLLWVICVIGIIALWTN